MERLNIEADKISTTCATIPLNIALPTAPFAMYIKGECIHLPRTIEFAKSVLHPMQRSVYN